MANKYRAQVPFPVCGKGAYIHFNLDDLAELESEYGLQFFEKIEEGAVNQSVKVLKHCLSIGLKSVEDGKPVKIWNDLDIEKLIDEGFTIGSAGKPVLESVAQSWLGKSYDDMVKEAEAARKKQEEEQLKNITNAVKTAKEAAAEADIPFDGEASLNLLLTQLTGLASVQSQSGN